MDALKPHPQFVDAVSQIICLGATKLVPFFLETLNSHNTFCPDSLVQRVHPIKDRDRPVHFPKKDDLHVKGSRFLTE